MTKEFADLEQELLHKILNGPLSYEEGLAEEVERITGQGIPIRGHSIRVLLTIHAFLMYKGDQEILLKVEEALWEAFHAVCYPGTKHPF